MVICVSSQAGGMTIIDLAESARQHWVESEGKAHKGGVRTSGGEVSRAASCIYCTSNEPETSGIRKDGRLCRCRPRPRNVMEGASRGNDKRHRDWLSTLRIGHRSSLQGDTRQGCAA